MMRCHACAELERRNRNLQSDEKSDSAGVFLTVAKTD